MSAGNELAELLQKRRQLEKKHSARSFGSTACESNSLGEAATVTTESAPAALKQLGSEDRTSLLVRRLADLQDECEAERARRAKVELDAVARVQELSGTVSRLRLDCEILRKELGDKRADEILKSRRDSLERGLAAKISTAHEHQDDIHAPGSTDSRPTFVQQGLRSHELQVHSLEAEVSLENNNLDRLHCGVFATEPPIALSQEQLGISAKTQDTVLAQVDSQRHFTHEDVLGVQALAQSELAQERKRAAHLEKELEKSRAALAEEQSRSITAHQRLEDLSMELQTIKAALGDDHSKATKAACSIHTFVDALIVEKNKLEAIGRGPQPQRQIAVDDAVQILWRLLFVFAEWRGPEGGSGRFISH